MRPFKMSVLKKSRCTTKKSDVIPLGGAAQMPPIPPRVGRLDASCVDLCRLGWAGFAASVWAAPFWCRLGCLDVAGFTNGRWLPPASGGLSR